LKGWPQCWQGTGTGVMLMVVGVVVPSAQMKGPNGIGIWSYEV
jgi:hypothetical protein